MASDWVGHWTSPRLVILTVLERLTGPRPWGHAPCVMVIRAAWMNDELWHDFGDGDAPAWGS